MIEFEKYHGLGNDFLIVEGGEGDITPQQVVAICRRHVGVGADGVLLIERCSAQRAADISMVIFNRDATRPEMCGNGVRCVAAYAAQTWGFQDRLIIDSDAGPRPCVIDGREDNIWHVSVDMGVANVTMPQGALHFQGRDIDYIEVDMGNPHAVVFGDMEREFLEAMSRWLNHDSSLFPQGVNVEMAVEEKEATRYDTVVYERGVGFTQACGTGACAVAAAAWRTGRVDGDQPICVALPGGALTMTRRDGQIWMNGTAQKVFSGHWSMD